MARYLVQPWTREDIQHSLYRRDIDISLRQADEIIDALAKQETFLSASLFHKTALDLGFTRRPLCLLDRILIGSGANSPLEEFASMIVSGQDLSAAWDADTLKQIEQLIKEGRNES